MTIFDTTYCGRESEKPARYGLPWNPDELSKLKKLFVCGAPLPQICATLQRPAAGVIAKLEYAQLIKRYADGNYYLTEPTEQSEPAMNPTYTKPPTIETKTFIGGTDAKDMTDEQIFDRISDLENSTKRWDNITNKPKKLQETIAKIQADVAALVAYVDSRP